MESVQHHHPDAPALRERAVRLVRLADTIEGLQVMTLPERADRTHWTGWRAELASAVLGRNLHQLHRAADDLRTIAHHFRARADELDAAHRDHRAA